MTEQTSLDGRGMMAGFPASEGEEIWAEATESDAGQDDGARDQGADDLPRGDGGEPYGDRQPADPAAAYPGTLAVGDMQSARDEIAKLKAENARLQQVSSANSGRASAAQRRLNDLQREIDERRSRPVGESVSVPADIRAHYPDIIEPLTAEISSVKASIKASNDAEIRRLEGERANEIAHYTTHVYGQDSALRDSHPDFNDVINANADAFMTWIDDQPKALRDAFAANADHITDAEAARNVVVAFKTYLNRPASGHSSSQTATMTSAMTSARRQRQLAAASSPAGRSRGPEITGIPRDADPETIWNLATAGQ